MGAAAPKQYLQIAGRPLLYHALRAVARHPGVARIFVVLAPDDAQFRSFDWHEFGERLAPLYCGGTTRAATVLNGLLAARDTIGAREWVLVHDAVRPCLGRPELDRLFANIGEDETGGLLALPVADTVKRADRDSRVSGTEPR